MIKYLFLVIFSFNYLFAVSINNTELSLSLAKFNLIKSQISKEESLYEGIVECLKINGLPSKCDTVGELEMYISSSALISSTNESITFNTHFFNGSSLNSYELIPRLLFSIDSPLYNKLTDLYIDNYYGFTYRNENYILSKAYNETWFNSKYGTSSTNDSIFKKDKIFYGFTYELNRFVEKSVNYQNEDNTEVSLAEPTKTENKIWYQPNGDLTFTKYKCITPSGSSQCSFELASSSVSSTMGGSTSIAEGGSTTKEFVMDLEDATCDTNGKEIYVKSGVDMAESYLCYEGKWYSTSPAAGIAGMLPVNMTHKAWVSSMGGGSCSASSPCTIQEALDQDPSLREIHVVDSPADSPIEITGDLDLKKVTLIDIQDGNVLKVNGYIYLDGSYKSIELKVGEGAELDLKYNFRLRVAAGSYVNKITINNSGYIENKHTRGLFDGWHDGYNFNLKEFQLNNKATGVMKLPYYALLAHSYKNTTDIYASKAKAQIKNDGYIQTANGIVYLAENWELVELVNNGEILQSGSGLIGWGYHDRNLVNTGDPGARVLKHNIVNTGKIKGALGSNSESLFYLTGDGNYNDDISMTFDNSGEITTDGTIIWGRWGMGTLDFKNTGTLRAANYNMGIRDNNSYWDDGRAYIIRWWSDYGHVTHKFKMYNEGTIETPGRPFLMAGEYRTGTGHTSTELDINNQGLIDAGRGSFYFNHWWSNISFVNGSENNTTAVMISRARNTADSDILGGNNLGLDGLVASSIKNYGKLWTWGDVIDIYTSGNHGSARKHEITLDNWGEMMGRDYAFYVDGYQWKKLVINNYQGAKMWSNHQAIRVWESEVATAIINNDGIIQGGGHQILINGYHAGNIEINNGVTGQINNGSRFSYSGSEWAQEMIHIRDFEDNTINNQGQIRAEIANNAVRIYGNWLNNLYITNGSPTNTTASWYSEHSALRLWESADVTNFFLKNYGKVFSYHHGFLVSMRNYNAGNTSFPQGTYFDKNILRPEVNVENYGELKTVHYSPLHFTGFIETFKVFNDQGATIDNQRNYHLIYSGSDTLNIDINNQGNMSTTYYRSNHSLLSFNMYSDPWSGAKQNKFKLTNGSPTNTTARILGSYAVYAHSGYVNHLDVKNYGEIRGGESNGGYRALSFWDSLDVDHIDIYNASGAKIEGQSEALIINGNSWTGYGNNRINNPNLNYLKVENHGSMTGYRNNGIRFSYGNLRTVDILNTGTIAQVSMSHADIAVYIWHGVGVDNMTLRNTGDIYSRSHVILGEGYSDNAGTFKVENTGKIYTRGNNSTTIRTNNFKHFDIKNGEVTINGNTTTNTTAEISQNGSGMAIRFYSAGNHGNVYIKNNGLIKAWYDVIRAWDYSGIGNVTIENNGTIQGYRDRVIFFHGRHNSNYKFSLINNGRIERLQSYNDNSVIRLNYFSYIDIINKSTSSYIGSPYANNYYGRAFRVNGEVRDTTSYNGKIYIENNGHIKSPYETIYAWDGIDNFELKNTGIIESYRSGTIMVNGDPNKGLFKVYNAPSSTIKVVNPNNNEGTIYTDQFRNIDIYNDTNAYIGSPMGDGNGRALLLQGYVRGSSTAGINITNKGTLESRYEPIHAWGGIRNFTLNNYKDINAYYDGAVYVNGDHNTGTFNLNNYSGSQIKTYNPNNNEGTVHLDQFAYININNEENSYIGSPTSDSNGRGIYITGEVRDPSYNGKIDITNKGIIESRYETIHAWNGIDNFYLKNYGRITSYQDGAIFINGDAYRGDFTVNNIGNGSKIEVLNPNNNEGIIHTHEFKYWTLNNEGIISSPILNENYGRGIYAYGDIYNGDGKGQMTINNSGTIQSYYRSIDKWDNQVQNFKLNNSGTIQSKNERAVMINAYSNQGTIDITNSGSISGKGQILYFDQGRYYKFNHLLGNQYNGSGSCIFRENIPDSWIDDRNTTPNINVGKFKC